MTGRFLLFLVIAAISARGFGQVQGEEDLYGKWRILGDFRDGEQTLEALKDTIKNPKHYYFYFNSDGTYTSDVVSLKWGYKGKQMKGKWELDSAGQNITFTRFLSRKEQRKIPKQWVKKHANGSFTLVPVKDPVIEFSDGKLVLYDEQHKTYDVYVKQK